MYRPNRRYPLTGKNPNTIIRTAAMMILTNTFFCFLFIPTASLLLFRSYLKNPLCGSLFFSDYKLENRKKIFNPVFGRIITSDFTDMNDYKIKFLLENYAEKYSYKGFSRE